MMTKLTNSCELSQGLRMNPNASSFNRREFLWRCGGGLGGIAMAHLLGSEGLLADTLTRPNPAFNGGLHHPAKVKRIVQLFMNGGASQVDLFDYKPELVKTRGEKIFPGGKSRTPKANRGN